MGVWGAAGMSAAVDASVVSVASLVVVTVDAGPGLIVSFVFVSFGGEVFSTSASI